ncbi:MAG: hypothetical protein ACTHJ8_18280 [Mucilaginibacter sp.]|jgi:hypothetical protein
MERSVIAGILALFFVTGSSILPLGDFSLMNDLPSMYKAYCHVRVGEPDVLDFIGDYLMGGKDILGHNHEDRPVKSSPIHYQHQASMSLFYMLQLSDLPAKLQTDIIEHIVQKQLFHTSDYQGKLLRPPLA